MEKERLEEKFIQLSEMREAGEVVEAIPKIKRSSLIVPNRPISLEGP